MIPLSKAISSQSTVLSHFIRALIASLRSFYYGRNTRKNVRAGHSVDHPGDRSCLASPSCQKDKEGNPCMGRLHDSFRTGKPDPRSDASSVLSLTKTEPAVHDWYRIVYVRWLVIDFKGSVGSRLIPRYRNRTWESWTTHKASSRWLARI